MRNSEDEDHAKVLVGKLYPVKKVFASVVDAKGTDEVAVNRMTTFINESGLTDFVYKNDTHNSIISLTEDAVRRSGRAGHRDPPGDSAVPENSAAGESASNNRAERAVQEVEDLLHVNKLAMEGHVGEQLPCSHPVIRWLVEDVADVLTKSKVNSTGRNPYGEFHG